MDKLFGAAKEYLDDDKDKPQQQQQAGRYEQDQQYQQQAPLAGSNKPAGGLASFLGDLDFNDAKEEANKNAGHSGNSHLFSSVLSAVGQKQGKIAEEDVDEEDAVKKHKKTYDDDDDDADENSLGTAAAMQALKMFNKGETSGGSASGQSAFMGLAMSEASKLFDDKASKGKVPSSASKESTVQTAAEMAMKMYFKSQGQQQGGLAGFASKFV
ncbi:Fc.00g020740.m01.CDS01 [Cosmosporella sp. VM-42]